MTLLEFNLLDDNLKARYTWTGVFLADRKDGEIKVQLYSLNNFYVEVFYDPIENKITGFNAFSTISLLVPYV